MKTTTKTIVSCLGFVSSLSLVPETQLILFKYLKDKRSPVEPQDERWDLWRALHHPKHKTPLVTTSVPWHSAPSLYLTFTTTHSHMHKTRQKDSDLPPDGMQTRRIHQCRAVLCFRPQRCDCSFRRGVSAGLCVVRLTNVRTHKHTLTLCPSCVACNLVILGLCPVKGQLWNKITVCSAVRVSPEWCHGGTYTSANLDASHL